MGETRNETEFWWGNLLENAILEDQDGDKREIQWSLG
jgi:hypothetical protein